MGSGPGILADLAVEADRVAWFQIRDERQQQPALERPVVRTVDAVATARVLGWVVERRKDHGERHGGKPDDRHLRGAHIHSHAARKHERLPQVGNHWREAQLVVVQAVKTARDGFDARDEAEMHRPSNA